MSDHVCIVMLARNSGVHLRPAIHSIINNTEYPYRMVLVESESDDGTDEICDEYAEMYEHIDVVHTKREGVVKALNVGIQEAGEQDVYITHDDVIHPKLYRRDWLTELVRLSKYDNCGLITTMRGGGVSGESYVDGFKWAGTWSLYIPNRTIQRVGTFDENFSPGNGEDIDYSWRVHLLGLNIIEAQFWVDHHHMTEHSNDKRDDLEKLKQRNARYFRTKYGFQ